MISHGDFGIFIGRPVSLALLLATALFLLLPLFKLARNSFKPKLPAPTAPVSAAQGESR
jgi:TctA family transporter